MESWTLTWKRGGSKWSRGGSEDGTGSIKSETDPEPHLCE